MALSKALAISSTRISGRACAVLLIETVSLSDVDVDVPLLVEAWADKPVVTDLPVLCETSLVPLRVNSDINPVQRRGRRTPLAG